MCGYLGHTATAPVNGRVISRGTLGTTGHSTGSARRIVATMGMVLLLVLMIAHVGVFIAPATGTTGSVVIMAGKGWKCSWFKVKLRRLSGAGGILLLRAAIAAGRLLQMRLLLLLMLLLVVMVRVLLVKASSGRTPMMMMRMVAPTTATTMVMMMMTTTAASFATHRRNHVSRGCIVKIFIVSAETPSRASPMRGTARRR